MTQTTELHITYAGEFNPTINGIVAADYPNETICIYAPDVNGDGGTNSVTISFDEMHTLMDAFMEIDRVHKINLKTKGD